MKKFLFVIVAFGAMLSGMFLFNSQFHNKDFTTLEGQSYSWSDWRGKWVVVNYFAEWCAPCLREIPELNQFSQGNKGSNIQLFAVSYDNLKTSHLKNIRDKYQINFPVITSDSERVMLNPTPGVLPTTYIISPQGKVVKTLQGEQTQDGLLAELTALGRR